MFVIWKHFLANRRKGMLPALIALALFNLGGVLPLALASYLHFVFCIGFWAMTWFIALPATIYTMDHRPETPPVQRNHLN